MNHVVIVGGTGTLGKAVIKKLLARRKPPSILVLSREEIKQKILKRQFPQVTCRIADVKDPGSLDGWFSGADTVFNFAALKHVEIAEANPEECVKTNLQGAINCAKEAHRAGVDNFVFSSTDKAVLPINIYGHTKAAAEIYCLSLNGMGQTNYNVFRWGNVLGSRGSVIHSFAKTLVEEKTAYITDIEMTRFWINIDDAASFMLLEIGRDCDRVKIPPMRAAKVSRIARLTANYLGIDKFDFRVTGTRAGEKIHECLYTSHETCMTSDKVEQFEDDELLEMIAEALR